VSAGLKVEIWSDVVCPWCYIGKRRFEAALQGIERPVEVVWRSFELDPGASRVPEGGLAEELARKYGMSVAKAQGMMDEMTRAAAAEGLTFEFARARRGNTLDAHRLLHMAEEAGLQGEMKERLLKAYFTEGRAIAEPTELAALGAEVGLDPREVEGMLAGDAYAEAVRADQERARSLGIRGVPFFVFDGRLGLSGAQPPAVIRQALEQAAGDDGLTPGG
jgi:predicted DsbA family dithiol-disulfide isomerase